MPFYLYDTTPTPPGHQYRQVRKVQLAGVRGPLAQIANKLNPGKASPFTWHATEGDIITALSGNPACQAIVIDLKPKVAQNVSLYRLRDVWGHSSDGWTPIAILLESLFADHATPEPDDFKKEFTHSTGKPALVGEFLYLGGGVKGGKWNWGMVGRVNGALLWRDSFEYLASSLGRALNAKPWGSSC